MRLSKAYLRSFVADKRFYSRALSVMIPVVIQQLINTLFNVVDNVMVGSLDGISMSAVTVANKPFLIYSGVFFGVTGAGGILISQFYGAKDHQQCQRLFSLEFLIGLIASLIFCGILYFFPEQIMTLYVKDTQTIQLGIAYLKVICFSYIPVALSTTCMFSMRALGKNKMPMLASLVTMGLNAFFNYGLIFGNFGLPAMGVTGAALGTLLARLCELGFYLFVLARRKAFFSLDLLGFIHLKASTLKSFWKRALPLTGNELLWTIGLNLFFWTYARLDEPALPAMTIADQVMQVGIVVSTGMASAVSVMIGTELGADRFKQAWQNTKHLLSLVCGIALVCSAVASLGAYTLPFIFNVGEDLRWMATKLTLVYALFYLPNALYAFAFYCLRAGGDTRNATLLDSIYMWLLPVPVALLMGWLGVGRINLIVALFVVQLLMNSKFLLALWVVKKGKWLRNITTE
ncbi:MAG: MATE family efflux transporter [Clostridia bacterium]|nr:MATE family efflux transporter [Clostridia bacterium]